ncbi:MAG: response regulator [Dehalococcoidia bacterium]|nr:response regulator [Dehalococcoidia bacterium]
MSRILTISSEIGLTEQIASALHEAGFAISNASAGLEGLKMLGEEQFDLVIIEEPLADADAWSVCRQAHSFGSPIILLGTESQVEAWGRAEEAGFDFYFKKPFSSPGLIARIKVLLRRYSVPSRAAPAEAEVATKAEQALEAEPSPSPQQVEESVSQPRKPEVERPVGTVKQAPTLDPRTLKLLEKMLAGEYVQIAPAVNLASKIGFSYPEVSELLRTDEKETSETLESLVQHNILEKQFFETLFSCPKCESFQIQLSIRCPACHGQHLNRCPVLEHFPCGHVSPEEFFATENGYLCPKCKRALKAVGLDYRNLGIHYRCQNCGELCSSPTEEYHCLKCQAYFPKYEAREVTLYGYKFNEAERLHTEAEVKRKTVLTKCLSELGYHVTSPAKVTGKSGREHELAIYASKNSGVSAANLAIDIAYDERGVPETEVLKLYAKAFDIGAQKMILIAMPEISSDALPFADQYNVIVTQAKDLDEAAQKLPKEVT